MGVNLAKTARDNYFVLGDYCSKDWGIILSGDNVFDSPARDVDRISVPGRNGDLIIDNGRWNNVDVTYNDCLIANNFPETFADFRAKIARLRGYVRLEDTFNPDEYRMASLSKGIKIDRLGTRYHSGRFDLTFNCKPQRFLKSGDLPTQFLPLVRGSTTSGLSTSYIPYKTGEDITLTLSYIKPLTIIWRVFDEASGGAESSAIYTEQKTVANGETVTFQQTERTGATYWRLYFVGWDYGEGVDKNLRCKIKTVTTFNGAPFRIDGTIGKTWEIINPTGYTAVPLIKFYVNKIEATFTDYAGGVEGRHSQVSQTSAQTGLTLQIMDCDLQYLISENGQKIPFRLEDDLSIIEEGTLFPYLGADKTVIFSELTTATMDSFYGWSGLGMIEVYPRWWRL